MAEGYNPASMVAQLVGAGVFSGNSPVNTISGGRAPILMGLGDVTFNNMSPRIGWADNKIGGQTLGAAVYNGGGGGRYGGPPSIIQRIAASVVEGGKQAAAGADAYRAAIAAGVNPSTLSQISYSGDMASGVALPKPIPAPVAAANRGGGQEI